MSLIVTGGSGFIGAPLSAALLEKGHALTLLTRRAPPDSNTGTKRWLQWTPGTLRDWDEAVDGADGVINLAGEPIVNNRWSPAQRRRLEKSRIDSTHSLVQACAKAKVKPKFLINASAVGYYGPRGDEVITENMPAGEDFLARLCRDWEEEAKKAEALDLRVVRLRIGIVLGPGGGALKKMVFPFKFFVGGPLGSGQQWLSWIHLEDLVRLLVLLVESPQARGPFNATAPNPVRNKEFSQALGKLLHRPSWMPVPGFALKLALGERADMLLTGQRVIPAAAEKLGFKFRYPELSEALRASVPR